MSWMQYAADEVAVILAAWCAASCNRRMMMDRQILYLERLSPFVPANQ